MTYNREEKVTRDLDDIAAQDALEVEADRLLREAEALRGSGTGERRRLIRTEAQMAKLAKKEIPMSQLSENQQRKLEDDLATTDLQRYERAMVSSAERMGLTPRMIEVACLIDLGYSQREVAALLGISEPAVTQCVQRAQEKILIYLDNER